MTMTRRSSVHAGLLNARRCRTFALGIAQWAAGATNQHRATAAAASSKPLTAMRWRFAKTADSGTQAQSAPPKSQTVKQSAGQQFVKTVTGFLAVGAEAAGEQGVALLGDEGAI
jgi:hypothetical protein